MFDLIRFGESCSGMVGLNGWKAGSRRGTADTSSGPFICKSLPVYRVCSWIQRWMCELESLSTRFDSGGQSDRGCTTDRTRTLPQHVCTPGVWRRHKLCERSGKLGETRQHTHGSHSAGEILREADCVCDCGSLRRQTSSYELRWYPASSERKETAPTGVFSQERLTLTAFLIASPMLCLLILFLSTTDSAIFDRCWLVENYISSAQTLRRSMKLQNKLFWDRLIRTVSHIIQLFSFL